MGRWTSALAMLAFGLCTLVWPYTKSFFRDPPVMLGFAIALWGFVRWQGDRRRRYALVGLIGVLLAIGAKLSSGFAVPGLLVLALPMPAAMRRLGVQRVLLGLLLAAFALLTVLVYNEALFNGGRGAATLRYDLYAHRPAQLSVQPGWQHLGNVAHIGAGPTGHWLWLPSTPDADRLGHPADRTRLCGWLRAVQRPALVWRLILAAALPATDRALPDFADFARVEVGRAGPPLLAADPAGHRAGAVQPVDSVVGRGTALESLPE